VGLDLPGFGVLGSISLQNRNEGFRRIESSDSPPPVRFSWTGFYVGANAGWGTLRDEDAQYCIDPAGVVMGKGCSRVFGGQVRGDGFIGGARPATTGSPAGGFQHYRFPRRVAMGRQPGSQPAAMLAGTGIQLGAAR
jgi:hypothetical protein